MSNLDSNNVYPSPEEKANTDNRSIDNLNSDNQNSPMFASGGYPAIVPQMSAVDNCPYPCYTPYKRKEQDEILGHTSSRRALITVILCWIFGILFSEIFLNGGFGASVPILMSLFYGIVFWYFSSKEQIPTKSAFALLIPVIILSLGYFIHDNGTIYFINTLILLALIPLQLSFMSSTSIGPVFSLQSFYHTLISTIVRPLSYLDAPFKTLSSNIGHRHKASNSAMIFWGLIIAFPIAALFIVLFSQADSAFGYFVDRLINFKDISFGNTFFDLFFGTATAIFISAMLITMRARKVPEKRKIELKTGINGLLTATVLFVINLVQIAFVLIQFSYLFAGMKLPDNMSYASYARSGFFELCGVLCISILIIMFCLLFVKKDENKKLPKAVSLLLTIFIACNYVIVVSAIYRMLTYISAYDLSVKRVMVTWLIIVFALCMIGAVIKIWIPKFRTLNYVFITVIIMTVAINLINVNALVANYNVNSYIKCLSTQQTRDIDVQYLSSLGPSAAEATLNLFENGDSSKRLEAKKALNKQKSDLNQKCWKNFTLADIHASKVLDNIK